MNQKAFGILILVAGIFAVLAIIGQNRIGTGSIAGDSAGTRLLTGLADNLNGVNRVLVTGAGSQQLVGLERSEDEWIVTEAGGYPAERAKVNALLIALAEARVVEEKTANPDLHARLGVETITSPEATGLEVSLFTNNDERFDVVIGDTYSAGQVYARLADANQSVLLDRNPEIARDPSDWVITEIINVAGDRVQRVEITQASGETLVIRKDARGAVNFDVDDVPDDRELQYAGVANVTANLLQGLRLDAVRPAADTLIEPTVISEFWMFDGLVVTVTTTGEGDDAWLTFNARFEVDQALTFAEEDIADELGAADSTEAAVESDAAERSANSSLAEADEIDRRLADWQYRIPAYQLSQLTRRMDDLLQPEPTE